MGGLESDASGNDEAGVIELVESPRFALMTPDVVDLVLCTLEKASGAGRSFKPESDGQGAFYS